MRKNFTQITIAVLCIICAAAMIVLPLTMLTATDDTVADTSAQGGILNSAAAADDGDITYYIGYDNKIHIGNIIEGSDGAIADFEVTSFVIRDRDIIYATPEGSIRSYCQENGKDTPIYSGSLAIGSFSICGDTIWFCGYDGLFNIDSDGQADQVLSMDGLSDITMTSADEIVLYVDNPAYIEEVMGGEYDFDESNDQYITYKYNIAENLLVEYDEGLESISISDDMSVQYLTSTEGVSINGVSFPFADYPVGSFFTKNGKSCTCHGQGICVASGSRCNCMRYWPTGLSSTCQVDLLSSQCMGFARFCMWRAYGYFDGGTGTSKCYNAFGSKLSAGRWTANTIKECFTSVGPGGHIRTGSGHSLFVMSVSSTGFITYECNKSTVGNMCIIYTRSWTWDTFYSYYGSRDMLYYSMPKDIDMGGDVSGAEDAKVGMYQTLADILNMREQPTTSSSILTQIPYGTPLSVTEIQRIAGYNWGKTTYNGYTGWVRLDYAVYISTSMTSIAITNPPDKTKYYVGDKFDTSGMEVTAYFSDGTSMVIEGYTCSGYNMNTAGKYTVIVAINGLTTSYSIEVTVKIIYPTSIKINSDDVVLILGDTHSLSATIAPSDATDKSITWKSSDSSIVSVSSNGALTVKKQGTVTISATTVNNLKSTMTVTAIKMPTGADWSVTVDGEPLPDLPLGIDAQDYSIRYQIYKNGSWSDWIYGDVTQVTGQTTRCQFRSFTVTLISDGKAIYGPQPIDINTYFSIEDYSLERDGYLFAGWFTNNQAALSLDSDYAAKRSTLITGDLVLYAGWIELSSIAADPKDDLANGPTVSAFGVFGTGVRADEESVGLRFYSTITKSLISDLAKLNSDNKSISSNTTGSKNIGYGTVVILASSLSGDLVKGSVGNEYLSYKKAVTVPAINAYEEFDTYIIYTAYVTGYDEDWYDSDFVARPYITYKDVNGYTHTYYDSYTGDGEKGGGLCDNLHDAADAAFQSGDYMIQSNIEEYIYKVFES